MTPRTTAAVLSLALATAALPLAAGAATTPPLRTLSYTFTVAVADVRESTSISTGVSRARGEGRARDSRRTSPATGSGEKTSSANVQAAGSIDIAVLSATEDAGLVVDVAENATQRIRPKVRIVVGPDGALFYNPSEAENLTQEEVAVVRWLARGFYADRPTERGTSWTVDQSANGHTDVEHYRVVSADAQRVTLGYSLEEKTPGAAGYAAVREGTLVYDTALIVPVTATFTSDVRRQVGYVYETLRTSVSLALVADSFAPRKP